MRIINILLSEKKGGVEKAFITHCEILKKFLKSTKEIY